MKKVLFLLVMLFSAYALFAEENQSDEVQETTASKEKPAMYAGAVVGVDGHCGPYINHYFWSLALEPHFGIYPFSKKNMGLEASFRFVSIKVNERGIFRGSHLASCRKGLNLCGCRRILSSTEVHL